MNMTIAKFVGCWVSIILSIIFLVLGAGFASFPLYFAVLACAFALAPAAM